MKKIQINANKLQLNKDKVANLTSGEMSKIVGGYFDFAGYDKRGSRSGRTCLCCTGCCVGDMWNGQAVGQLMADGSPMPFDGPEYAEQGNFPMWPDTFTQQG